MKLNSRTGVLFLAVGLILALLAIRSPAFFDRQPLLSLAAREAPTILEVCGMTLIMISRQVDISIGSQFAVAGVVGGLAAAAHWPIAAVLLVSIGSGTILGILNGALVSGLGLPAIVVTLATTVTWREGLDLLRQGQFINLPDGLQWFGFSQAVGQGLIIAVVLGVVMALGWALGNISALRRVYATGSDAEAARLAGLRPRRVTFVLFAVMGALTGMAAAFNLVQSPQVDPKMGTGLELRTIAAVVVGGVAISGGRGTLLGAFVGSLLLACIGPALVHLRIDAYWEKAIQGAVILLAVSVDAIRNRGRLGEIARA